jgi:hypothetical protein
MEVWIIWLLCIWFKQALEWLYQSFQAGSGAHPAWYPASTGGLFRWGQSCRAWTRPLTSI